ncbi:MAG: hypothetical protein IJV22_01405 [Bacteroidales bacterium]|nr:hypothetical protein [Bacteroidales bacterium]
MKTHLRTILATIMLLATATGVNAQSGINAPYSQYGIGLGSTPYNYPWAAANGGTTATTAAFNIINPFNPASAAAIEPESFVFDMGFNFERAQQNDPTTSTSEFEGSIAYLSAGFPITRWWKTTVGLIPLSTTAYATTQPVKGADWDSMNTRYEGNGGLNQVFWNNAFNVAPHLRLGVGANYLFGTIQRAITYDFKGLGSTYFINSRRQKNTTVSNLTFQLGAQYDIALPNDHLLSLGLTAKVPQRMKVNDESLAYTYVDSNYSEYIRDTIFPLPGQSGQYKSTLAQPLAITFGAALSKINHWQVAIEAAYSPWSGLKYTEGTDANMLGSNTTTYGNNYRMALSAERCGNPNEGSYWRRMALTAGAHYERGKLRLNLNNEQYVIDEWGFGAGVRLPMRKGRSTINIAVAYRSIGTADLLKQNTITLGIGVSSCEKWFTKRKYN